MELTEIQNERYCRSMICDGFSQAEQAKLLAASVLVVGAGGLGSAVLSYLVAAGVGRIGIVEFDNVSLSNLQRQILY
ncbi:MAG: ThiF family adenylyltransferase, partial [Rikenellaceae bacterium]|nr:ThiF family adenylyltransferase [Rikenellaceae bacterium]